ncbi:GNAT family N-acetyltransferase [Microbacterium sp. B2969]|uniref:GNAT family N-acetyltransferase n=1 Tax=Microbacterium alkaliflavum TaxID=3248839 RepID=A0ABW7QC15_9MICO
MPDPTALWTIETVPWDDERAAALRDAMDAEVSPRYADRLDDISDEQAERIGAALGIDPDSIVATIVATDADARPVGHAALRDLGLSGALEVKRVFVDPGARGSGVSRALMAELERIAVAEGAGRLILQTGDRQPDAIALYEKIGYTRIPIYPPYLDISFSHCFEKSVA